MPSVAVTNSTSPQWELPVETCTQVLSYLNRDDDSDVRTLIACSQVSRDWNVIVLPLLFSQLTIAFVHDNTSVRWTERDIGYRNLARDDNHSPIPKHFSSIPFLLRSTAARILPFVRRLRLLQLWNPNHIMHTQAYESNYVDPEPLCDVICQFTSLKQLHLLDIVLRSCPTVTSESRIQGLEELHIERVRYHRRGKGPVPSFKLYERRLWMLRLFGHVQQLWLRYFDDRVPIEQDMVFASLSDSSFSTAAVYFSGMTCAAALLRAFQSSPRIHSTLQSVDGRLLWHPSIFTELAALYSKLPQGLRHLGCALQILEGCGNDEFDVLLRLFNSPGFTNIQSLEFHYLQWMDQRLQQQWYARGIQATSTILYALSSLNLAPQLQRLKLNVKASVFEIPEGDISLLPETPEGFTIMQDSLLCLPAFKMLVINAVQPRYEDREPVKSIPPSLRAFYQRVFSTLHRDGRLQITPARNSAATESAI